MLLQTILNRVPKIKGFVFGAARYGERDSTREVAATSWARARASAVTSEKAWRKRSTRKAAVVPTTRPMALKAQTTVLTSPRRAVPMA